MARRDRPSIHPDAVVWRISEGNPQGEWVRKGAPPALPRVDAPDAPESWITSSFDLLNGVDVDDSGDTIPGELFSEFVERPRGPAKPADE